MEEASTKAGGQRMIRIWEDEGRFPQCWREEYDVYMQNGFQSLSGQTV